MSVSVRIRFEVFKRDRFTCAYCGKHPPDVLLEADHIIPKAAGGSDEITNLTTACWDCNRGKSDRMLEEGVTPAVARAKVDDLRERLEQAAEYAKLIGTQENLIAKQLQIVIDVWARAFAAAAVEEDGGTYWRLPGHYAVWPNERSIKLFLRRLPVNEILAAIDIAASTHEESTEYACRLFYKVCWRRIKGETGPIDEAGPRSDHGEGRCVPTAHVEEADRRADRLERIAEALAFRLSEITGDSESDVLAWAEREIGL